jgi:hypothetical protein
VLYADIVLAAMPLVLIRFGILPVVLWSLVADLLFNFCVTTDFSAWYAGNTFFVVGVILALTGYAFHTALAGRKLFQESIFE